VPCLLFGFNACDALTISKNQASFSINLIIIITTIYVFARRNGRCIRQKSSFPLPNFDRRLVVYDAVWLMSAKLCWTL
jgi:hypothetical protein